MVKRSGNGKRGFPSPPRPRPPDAPRRDGSYRRLRWLPVLLAVALYASTVGHGYVLDDPLVTTGNTLVSRGAAGLPGIFSTNMLHGVGGFNDGLYRPLMLATLALEAELAGFRPPLSHAVNVLLYALTAWALVLVLEALTGGRSRGAVLVAALLFVAHPVHVEAVANVKGRDEILAFLFGIAAIPPALRYVRAGSPTALGLSLLAFALAFLSKESAVTFAVAVPLAVWYFAQDPGRRLWKLAGGLGAAALGLVAWRTHVIRSMDTPMDPGIVGVLNNSVLAAGTPLERLATAFRLQLIYLGKVVFPHTLAHDYSFAQVPVASPSSLPFLGALVAVGGLLTLAVRGVPSRSPVSFGILFYFLTLLPVSNLIFPIGATLAERFLYTPLLGMTLAAGFLILPGGRGRGLDPRAAAVLVLLAVSVLSARSVVRSLEWKDNLSLFSADVDRVEASARAHYNLGSTLQRTAAGEDDPKEKARLAGRAVAELEEAIRIYPAYLDAYTNLGNAYLQLGLADSAVAAFRRSLDVDPGYSRGRKGLGLALFQAGRYGEAVPLLEAHHEGRPDDFPAAYALGVALGRLGRYRPAAEVLRRAAALAPDNVDVLKDLGTVHGMAGDHTGALRVLLEAEPLAPRDPTLLRNIAVCYRNLDEPGKAREYMARARAAEGG